MGIQRRNVEVHIGRLTDHWQANTFIKPVGQMEAIPLTGHRCTDFHLVTHLYKVLSKSCGCPVASSLFSTNLRVYLVNSARFGQLLFHAAS